MESLRVQKYLSQNGVASRREAERMIEAGFVQVNGKVVRVLGAKINPVEDSVKVKGKLIRPLAGEKSYYLLNKPPKCITSKKDEVGRTTVFDLPKVRVLKGRLVSVGRLDYDTEGLLLLSNDGEFVQRLTHPKYKVPRHYYVKLSKPLDDVSLDAIQKGPRLRDGKVNKVKVFKVLKNAPAPGNWYSITVYEGRNRLVRRIFESQGCTVRRLIRYGIGDLRLPTRVKRGEVTALTKDQVAQLSLQACRQEQI